MSTIYKMLKNNKRVLVFPIVIWVTFTVISLCDVYSLKGNFTTINLNVANLKWSELFFHNASSAILMILLGNLTFGIASSLMLLYNAYLTSASIYYVYLNSGSIIYSVLLIFTHGLIEILAISLAFLLSTSTLRKFINKRYNAKKFYINSVSEKMSIFITILILLLFAAIIEANISFLVAKQFIK